MRGRSKKIYEFSSSSLQDDKMATTPTQRMLIQPTPEECAVVNPYFLSVKMEEECCSGKKLRDLHFKKKMPELETKNFGGLFKGGIAKAPAKKVIVIE